MNYGTICNLSSTNPVGSPSYEYEILKQQQRKSSHLAFYRY